MDEFLKKLKERFTSEDEGKVRFSKVISEIPQTKTHSWTTSMRWYKREDIYYAAKERDALAVQKGIFEGSLNNNDDMFHGITTPRAQARARALAAVSKQAVLKEQERLRIGDRDDDDQDSPDASIAFAYMRYSKLASRAAQKEGDATERQVRKEFMLQHSSLDLTTIVEDEFPTSSIEEGEEGEEDSSVESDDDASVEEQLSKYYYDQKNEAPSDDNIEKKERIGPSSGGRKQKVKQQPVRFCAFKQNKRVSDSNYVQ